MPKARLIFSGDNLYTEKNSRVYKLKQEIETKIDTIPGVVDNLVSISATDALSANMGRELQDQINALSGNFHFLSTWDCTTGLPGSNPQVDPYTYVSGDYYIVSTIGGTGETNYKPHGSSYTQGVPSTEIETGNVAVNDWYIYDGAIWVLQPAGGQTIVVDTQMNATSVNPVQNRVITQTLDGKQDTISDLNTIRSGASAGATALQPNDNITELTNNIGYQTAGDVNSAIQTAIAGIPTYTAGTGISIDSNNEISNIGVTSVNGQDGAITINEFSPDNAGVTGQVLTKTSHGYEWENGGGGGGGAVYTAGENITIDSNNVISAIDTTYNAGTGIEIKSGHDIQGPCPDGWHIGTSEEWAAISSCLANLGATNQDNWLKIPLAGGLDSSNGQQDNEVGQYGNIWTTDVLGAGVSQGIVYYFPGQQQSVSRYNASVSKGQCIRPIKNEIVIPDGNRTEIADGSSIAEGAGVFRNETEGLISMSEDGINWITIADKNLGAIIVYEDGDGLNINNCGNYYQWGNNYGFSREGATTTSNERVDVSNYGPSEYSSDVFITVSSWPTDNTGDYSKARNLWGGITRINVDNGIINKGVLSFNGEIGSVEFHPNEILVLSAAPSSPSEGTTYFNTTSKKMYVFDGSDWIEPGISYSARNGIALSPASQDMTKRQGPCNTGFHVPSVDEWESIENSLNVFGITSKNDIASYLYLPSFERKGNNGNISETTYYDYWTCDISVGRPFEVYMSQSGFTFTRYSSSNGLPVRPFKDVPAIPDENWTTIWATSAGVGIFRDEVNGLLSISSDGTNWITMSDKNVGASDVWYFGDTLTEANGGYSFQWGNNYGFAGIGGGVTTASGTVNVTGYGPDNPYNDSTFRINSSDWFVGNGDDLWGYVSGSPMGQAFVNTGVLSVNGQTGNVTNIVSGPSVVTDNNIAVYDGTTGELIKDSGLNIQITDTLPSGMQCEVYYDNGTIYLYTQRL